MKRDFTQSSSSPSSSSDSSSSIETQYQALLDEYTTLASQAPLTVADARRLGGLEFERQMQQQVAAGAYSADWQRQIEALSMKLGSVLEASPGEASALPYLERQRWMILQNQVDQLNPAVVLGLAPVPPPQPTTPDSPSDQLAEGATICQLFCLLGERTPLS